MEVCKERAMSPWMIVLGVERDSSSKTPTELSMLVPECSVCGKRRKFDTHTHTRRGED